MKKRILWGTGPVALTAALLALGGGAAEAQNCPLSPAGACQLMLGDVTKTVAVLPPPLPPNPRDQVRPGDVLEYTVRACNPVGAAPCRTCISDAWDNILAQSGIPADHLDQVPVPGAGCGGTLCQITDSLGTLLRNANTTRCGLDCTSPVPDQLQFVPNEADAGSQLQPGECYQWIIRAAVGPSISGIECLCNAATAGFDPRTSIPSNDPQWQSLAFPPGGQGCGDMQTCRFPGACSTCVRTAGGGGSTNPDLSTSSKCIDTITPCGGSSGPVPKTAGAALLYEFTIANTGDGDAPNVTIQDMLNFASDLGQPCIDRASVLVSPLTCLNFTPAGGCGPPDYTVAFNDPSLDAAFVNLPAAATPGDPPPTIRFTVSANVHAQAGGVCTNRWVLRHELPAGGIVPVAVNTPQFTVQSAAFLGNSTKCVDPVEAPPVASCTQAEPATAGQTLRYEVRFVNNGNLDAQAVVFTDDLTDRNCFAPIQNATCTPGPGCGGNACTITQQPTSAVPFQATMPVMPPGCEVLIVLHADVAAGATGQCCNRASAEYRDANGPGGFTTPQACAVLSAQIPDLATQKTPATQSVNLGDTVPFTITVTNNGPGVASGTLEDRIGDCMSVDCSQVRCEPSSAGTCGTCTTLSTSNIPPDPFNGFRFTFTNLPVGGAMTFTLGASTKANGTCNNVAETSDGLGNANNLSTASVTIGSSSSGYTVAKGVTPGTVGTGGTASFRITITNTGSTDLQCVFSDGVDGTGCMTLDAASCSATPPIASLTCAGGVVSTSSAFTLPASPGAPQLIDFDVTAGGVEGPCTNVVNVDCTGVGVQQAQATLNISNATCDLMNADVTFPPTTPPKTGAWVYTNTCAPGGRLPNVLTPAVQGDVDALGGAPGTLRLYQLDCPCTNRMALTKNAARTMVRLTFF